MKKYLYLVTIISIMIGLGGFSANIDQKKLTEEPEPSYREDAPSNVRHPEVDTNVYLYINHWRNSLPHEGHGGLIERDILTPGDPLNPPKKGAVLKYLKAYKRAVLQPRCNTQPTKHDKEQVFFYVMSGTGQVEGGNKKAELEEGTALVIPAGLEYRFFNPNEVPLEMIIVVEEMPNGFKPNIEMSVGSYHNSKPGVGYHWAHIGRGFLYDVNPKFANPMGMAVVSIDKFDIAQPHVHGPGCEEIWLQLKGKSLLFFGNRLLWQEPGEAFLIPPNNRVPHCSINHTDEHMLWLYLGNRHDHLKKSQRTAWEVKNDKIIKERNIKGRIRNDIPESKVVSNLEPGVVISINELPVTEIAPGVKTRIYWGKGILISWMTLEPYSEIPVERLPSERIMVVMKGSVDQLISGTFVTMQALEREEPTGINGGTPKNEFVFLEKGSKNAMKAGKDGAEIVEVYSPVRLDYMKKAGASRLPKKVQTGNFPLKPSVKPNKIYDLHDLQFTELAPGAYSRLISGNGAQLSFIKMNPDSTFDLHIHPEEQLMIVLRGWIDEIIMDKVTRMEKGDILLLPGNMVHGGRIGPFGCDVLDVFWPPRPDYKEKMERRLSAYHAIIPEDSKVELVVDGGKEGPGLNFTEGPSWLNGRLYFSSMYFDKDWNGDPKRSSLVEMDPGGTYHYISHGKMQTNGTKPLDNGNLAVCDMFGHHVIEMTKEGKVVRTLASMYNGRPFDGPNDLVINRKGGIYFTDPQFTPQKEKYQPGRSVYYLTPKGEVIRVIEPDEFAMPNGIALSPDGKTLYVNNTFDDEKWWNVDSNKDNFVWAYDISDDGTLSNARKFAELFLTPEVLDRKGKSSGADGMTVDELGNLYVATYMGLQIFSSKGEFIGIINFPVYPVNICFGDDVMNTIYATCYDKIYKIRTKVKGLIHSSKN
ncbi:MAG: SMP-30/gluconolactonase/LRE family protein [Acidobacteriota bacterium]